ncbi:MAG: MFS transporter [Bacilli bacterium]|nr:MFS transporter [Bacilli bacterium]
MENTTNQTPLKLNIKRTCIIGFAFFGILLLWQVYDSWCPTFLTELFGKALYGEANWIIARKASIMDPHANISEVNNVQYLVGIMMAIDNLAALILLPIFGTLSDKTHTKLGKRMPYIIVGTILSAVAFPFIPVLFHYNSLGGTIALMVIVVCTMMMYRNPAVALMPDITPKPLRSKANGIINIMGYIGGLVATLVGIAFVLSQYLGTKVTTNELGMKVFAEHTWAYNNVWAIEAPFLIASVLMVVSAVFLIIKIKENKIAEEIKDEMARGELEAEVVDKVEEDKPMTKGNLTMLILILAAVFFWFMADNGIGTFMGNYTVYYLGADTSSNMVNTIVGGVGSVAGFAIGGIIASKIGRKWTIVGGLSLTMLSYALWAILTFTVLKNAAGGGKFPWVIYLVFGVKGFGMSLVHLNSFPMVVELCPNKNIGKFTGYYYAASMAAQTITPVTLGLLLKNPTFNFGYLPVYALLCSGIALAIFMFVKSVKNLKTKFVKGLEALGADED